MFFKIVIIIGLVGLVAFELFTLVKTIINKRKNKKVDSSNTDINKN